MGKILGKADQLIGGNGPICYEAFEMLGPIIPVLGGHGRLNAFKELALLLRGHRLHGKPSRGQGAWERGSASGRISGSVVF
jgi:hypothetical protein